MEGKGPYYTFLSVLAARNIDGVNNKRLSFFTMLALALVLGYLSYLILRPFLAPIAWAIVFSIVFFPVYSFSLRYVKWRSAAAAITVLFVCLLILGPFSYFAYLLTVELSNVSVESFDFRALSGLLGHPTVKPVTDRLLSFLDISQLQLQTSAANALSDTGKKLVEYLPGRLGDAVGAALHFVLMVFALFFFLRDGPQFLARASQYLPFSGSHKERLTRQVKDIVISTIYGGIAVALAEGLIGAVTFALLAIRSPILWGLGISIASFLPVVGAAIVWVPAACLLLFKGAVPQAVILFVVGVFAISMVDNVLRPLIIHGRLRMPLLAIFFSVLGGIELFGLIGLVMGPLVLAVFISVVDMFRDIEEDYE
ncbi:MAG: AI-2E family transporter [Syntrophorhabdales bacterium]